jgi:hypothetical protein
VVILSGIKKGDPLVTGPFRTLKKLKDGAKVVKTKETKTSSKSKKDKDEDDK